MILSREIADLLEDPGPIARAGNALEGVRDAWLRMPRVAQVHAEFHDYAQGKPLEDCPGLREILGSSDAAGALIAAVVEPMCRALQDHPAGHVPFRHQYTGGIGVLQLMRCSEAALSLVCYEADACAADRQACSICFSDGERHELCLSGSGEARIFMIADEGADEHGDRARFHVECCAICPGTTLSFSGAARTKMVERVDGRLMLLRLSRPARNPEPAREYRISDGALLHRASGDRGESRAEMALALLGRMGRREAVDVMLEHVAQGGSAHLRWQALRHVLALDTARGYAALLELLADPDDPLFAPAGRLHRQLIADHPVLARLERDPCPA